MWYRVWRKVTITTTIVNACHPLVECDLVSSHCKANINFDQMLRTFVFFDVRLFRGRKPEGTITPRNPSARFTQPPSQAFP